MSSTSTSTGTSLQLQTKDSSGNLHNLPYPFQHIPRPFSRDPITGGRVLYVENFKSTTTSMFNDGAGYAYRDTDNMFMGYPTAKLDTNGIATGATDPGRSPDSSGGIVFKHRIQNDYPTTPGKYGMDFWWRALGTTLSVNNFFSAYIYNRDGATWHGGHIWFDMTAVANKTRILYCNQSANYLAVTPDSLYNPGGHPFDYAGGSVAGGGYTPDKTGEWNNVKLVVDLTNNQYVSLRMNNVDFTSQIGGQTLPSTADTSPTSLHMGVWFAAKNTSRRIMSVAYFVFTDES